MTVADVSALKKDFPIFARRVHGKPLVYLDNAATTQKPQCVIDAQARYYREMNANIHRGIHALSEEATAAYEGARHNVQRFLGAAQAEEIVFTNGTTSAINLVAHGWARKFLKPGDEILLSALEHHSNLIPWQMAARATGATLTFIPITREGTMDLSRRDALFTRRTRMVAVTAMSNALGTITPVKEIVSAAQAVGAKVLLDGAQSVPHGPTRVEDLGCDFLAFSAHKMLGPTGVGVLWAKRERLEEMDPLLGGGNMIMEVWRDRATWNDVPYKFEAGTPPVAGGIAFGVALDYLTRIGMETVHEMERELTRYAVTQLRAVSGLTLYGPEDVSARGGVFSFNLGNAHPHDVGTLLDREGVAVRAGHHCCQPLMRDWNIPGTVRASVYFYNDRSDIDALTAALRKAAARLA